LDINEISRDRQVALLAAELNSLADVDLLLDKMLEKARSIVRAEAGTVYTIRAGKLHFHASQNSYLERLLPESEELPFTGTLLEIEPGTLAGFTAMNKTVLTVNDTGGIAPDAPFQHFHSLDSNNNYVSQAVMSLPLVCRNNDLLGVLQIINPLDGAGKVVGFEKEDERLLAFFAGHASLALEKAVMLRESIINTVKIVEMHDYTESVAHAQRVAKLAAAIYANWSARHKIPAAEREEALNILPLAAMLHDVGKAWIPVDILTKPSRLGMVDRLIMEEHVKAGARLYASCRTPLDRLTHSLISDHHERWDGKGYPGCPQPGDGRSRYGKTQSKGKKGEEISIYGRIMAVADVFDALSSRRTYKEAFDENLAVQIMVQESGHHFDPSVIESFLAIRPILKRVRERFPEKEPGADYPGF
jgi:HD-GYP domain-containing protein (c-di-GMP phosphodiesterase class II)